MLFRLMLIVTEIDYCVGCPIIFNLLVMLQFESEKKLVEEIMEGWEDMHKFIE